MDEFPDVTCDWEPDLPAPECDPDAEGWSAQGVDADAF